MDILEKYLHKVAYKFPKGYFDIDDPQDRDLLESLVGQKLFEQEDVVTPEKVPGVLDLSQVLQVMNQAGIKDTYSVNGIKRIYNSYSLDQQKEFAKHFRKYTPTAENIRKITNIYADFFDVKASQGMGKGEVQTLLGLKGGKSGGTETKDIIVGSNIIEVKELSGGEFSLGKDGYANGTEYEKNYITLKSLITPESIIAFEDRLDEGQNKLLDTVAGYMAKNNVNNNSGNFIKGLIKVVAMLKPIIDDLTQDDINYITVNDGIKIFIDGDDAEQLVPGGEVNLKLGDRLGRTVETFNKLKKHPWINDPSLVEKQLYDIFDKFLGGITGVVFFNITSPNTQGEYFTREEIKQRFYPHRIAQNTLKAKIRKDEISQD